MIDISPVIPAEHVSAQIVTKGEVVESLVEKFRQGLNLVRFENPVEVILNPDDGAKRQRLSGNDAETHGVVDELQYCMWMYHGTKAVPPIDGVKMT
ncbi:MAG: hypothetical protein R3284_01665 [Rubricoccaceae bacterium]|nr:hypothetical protein [Rubricoccaceae bacterium]